MRDARPSFARARRRRSASRHPVPSRSPPSSTRAALGFSRTNEQRKRGERKRFAFVPRTPRAQTSPRGIPHTSRASVVMILARPRLALFALPVSPPSRRRRVAVAPLAASKKKKKQQPSDVGDSQDPVPVVEPSRTTKKEHWVEDSEDDGPLLDVDAGAKPRSVRGKNKKPVKTTASPAQKRAVTTPYGGRRATRPLHVRYGAVKIDTTRPTQVGPTRSSI